MRTTPEGRKLYAGAGVTGILVGAAAGVGGGIVFHNDSEFVPCNPNNPGDFSNCRELDIPGFALRSEWHAGLVIGGMVALVVFVLTVMSVLYLGTDHRHR